MLIHLFRRTLKPFIANLATLCCLQLGALPPPVLPYNGSQVVPQSFLGAGATCVVYECSIPGVAGPVVAKVVRFAYDVDARMEREWLQTLAGCPGVPRLLSYGELQDGSCVLFLQPKAARLDSRLLHRKSVASGVGQLVGCLKAAHATGLVHRDMRARNIMVQEEDGGTATWFIMDWCVHAG
jgi:serine/threonine protein kinase